MINYEGQTPASNTPSSRLDQLEHRLTANDVRVLIEGKARIQEFIRLGRKWKFFAIDADTSKKAGRDVMRNLFMPESGMAVMLEKEHPGFENRIDMALRNDPQMLATMLLDQVDTLQAGSKTSHVDTRFSREQLQSRFSEEDPVACVNVKPPIETWPEWFALIKRYELSPNDLEAIYRALDARTWKGQNPDVDILNSQFHEQIYQAIPSSIEGEI